MLLPPATSAALAAVNAAAHQFGAPVEQDGAALAPLRPKPPLGPGPSGPALRRPVRVSRTAPSPPLHCGAPAAAYAASAASVAAAAVQERARSVEAEQRRRDDEGAENAMRRVDRLTQRGLGRVSARGRLAQTAAMARVAGRASCDDPMY